MRQLGRTVYVSFFFWQVTKLRAPQKNKFNNTPKKYNKTQWCRWQERSNTQFD